MNALAFVIPLVGTATVFFVIGRLSQWSKIDRLTRDRNLACMGVLSAEEDVQEIRQTRATRGRPQPQRAPQTRSALQTVTGSAAIRPVDPRNHRGDVTDPDE